MSGSDGPLYYRDYLHLDRLLDAQHLESERLGATAHDEMLFVIVHQAYELWFKQILWELGAVRRLLGGTRVPERNIATATAHLERVTRIQHVLVGQIDVLETMTPLDFLDFRDLLIPASGFQSVQFRLIETELGLRRDERVQYGGRDFFYRLSEADRDLVLAAESEPTLFDLVDGWLGRTPFLRLGAYDFWSAYEGAVDRMLDRDREAIRANPTLPEEQRARQLEGMEETARRFRAMTDEDEYEALRSAGEFRMSHRGLTAALLINLYRDEPILHLPFRLLALLMDIDELFATWRHRHALMVSRMIGSKIGTGGSTGHDYLRNVADRHKVFRDLFTLSTFLLPRSERPALPEEVVASMGFRYDD